MLFKEVVDNRDALLKAVSPDRFIELSNTINYLTAIQTVQGVSFSEMPVSLFYGVTNKQEINLIAEKWLSENTQESKKEVIPIEAINEFKSSISIRTKALIEHHNNNISGQIRYVNDYSKRIHDCWKMIYDHRMKIASLEQSSDDIATKFLDKIFGDSFWRFLSFSNNRISFETREVVSIRNLDKNNGVDYVVVFGKFIVVYDTVDGSLLVYPSDLENNLNIRKSYYHPHIFENKMCFGNASDTVSRALKELNLYTVFDVIKRILITYNPESPYKTLFNFKQEQDRLNELGLNKTRLENIIKDFDPDVNHLEEVFTDEEQEEEEEEENDDDEEEDADDYEEEYDDDHANL